MASSNVVAAVATLAQQAQARGDKTAQTPAQWARQAGYPGNKASSLRQHIARQHGQGAQATGHGRYGPVTAQQLLVLLGYGHLARKADTTAQARKAASAKAAKVLWPAKRKAAAKAGAKAAKAQAQAADATAQPATPAAS